MGDGPAVRVQYLAEDLVQVVGPQEAAVHRREHLDVLDRVEPEARRDAAGDELDEGLEHLLRLTSLGEEEVAREVARGDWDLAPLDAVGVADDLARLPLAEDEV